MDELTKENIEDIVRHIKYVRILKKPYVPYVSELNFISYIMSKFSDSLLYNYSDSLTIFVGDKQIGTRIYTEDEYREICERSFDGFEISEDAFREFLKDGIEIFDLPSKSYIEDICGEWDDGNRAINEFSDKDTFLEWLCERYDYESIKGESTEGYSKYIREYTDSRAKTFGRLDSDSETVKRLYCSVIYDAQEISSYDIQEFIFETTEEDEDYVDYDDTYKLNEGLLEDYMKNFESYIDVKAFRESIWDEGNYEEFEHMSWFFFAETIIVEYYMEDEND